MIQGVREVFEIVDLDRRGRGGGGAEEGKLVLIGRGLDEGAFAGSLGGCLDVA